MQHSDSTRRRSAKRPGTVLFCAVAVLLFLTVPKKAFAHAVLQTSSPAANSTVHTGIVPVVLTYNSRVDAGHSSLALVSQDGKAQSLSIDAKAAPNILRSKTAPLPPGHYMLRWQAVAGDGHVTRGQIAFNVQ